MNNQNNKLDKQLIQRFLDMANCADASYARLDYVMNGKAPTDSFLNKIDVFDLLDDDLEKVDQRKIDFKNQDGTITTYARVIEARFDDNDITNIPKDTKPDQISQRTKDFVSRFELLEHKPDDEETGFSATLLKTQKQEFQGVFGA